MQRSLTCWVAAQGSHSGMYQSFVKLGAHFSRSFHMIQETRGPWATMLTWVNNYKSLIQHFRLSVVKATNQNEEFEQLLYAWWRITHQTFIKTFYQNTCNEIAIKSYFHVSHYTSMEILTCHSNESTWATTIKNKIYLEANVINIYAKFQLHPPYASEKKIFFYSKIKLFGCHGNQSKSVIWTKFI